MSSEPDVAPVPRHPLARFIPREATLYLLVSVAALAVDIATLFVATRFGASNTVGTIIGYSVGLVSHYLACTRLVFDYRRHKDNPAMEGGIYLATGLLGLLTSWAVVAVGDAFHVLLRYSKGAAIVISFVITYQARKWLLFSKRGAPSENAHHD